MISILRVASFLICVFFVSFYSNFSFSWSAEGHRFFSKQVQSGLTENEVSYLDDLATYLSLPKKSKQSNSNFYNRSNHIDGFVRLSSWPDQIRDKPLKEIFSDYQQAVPDKLWHYKQYNTSDWHYSNFYIYESAKDKILCNLKKKGRLQERLFALHEALNDSLNKTQEAIVMAFFLHLLQDLHQPLHLVSLVDDSCSSDLGGNKICLSKTKPFAKHSENRCRNNLHRLWDQGFGVFKNNSLNPMLFNSHIPDKAHKNITSFSEALISSWIDETRLLSEDVYSLTGGQSIESYERKSKEIVKSQTTLATQRSVYYLQLYIDRQHSGVRPSKTEGSVWEKIKRFLRVIYDA